MLFSPGNRADLTRKQRSEPEYVYLDRSGREEAVRIRQTLETWFSHYPDSHKRDLRRRFQTEVDMHFDSAFFELYLHELLLCRGYSVEVHPVISPGGGKKVDFGATARGEGKVLLEASLATGTPAVERGAQARMNALWDAVDQIESPNFFLYTRSHGAPGTLPRLRQWKKDIEKWLEGLDPDEVGLLLTSQRTGELPRKRFHHAGRVVEFVAYPKALGKRGKPGVRPIGMQSFGLGLCRAKEAIREAVLKKGQRYGRHAGPYIVAVNALVLGLDEDDVLEALFGTQRHQVSIDSLSSGKPDVQAQNALDGVWFGPSGPRYTRVSGALVAYNVSPWNVGSRDLRLYLNPWAAHPYDGLLSRLSVTSVAEGKVQLRPGLHPRDVLGLPHGWPE
jgi:hypothetical protein